MGFDTIITGGTVVDGTGRKRFRADVGLNGDSIEATAVSPPSSGTT